MFAFFERMTALRSLATLVVVAGLSIGTSASAAAQKTGSAATLPKKKNPAATPTRKAPAPKPAAPPSIRTDDPAALAQQLGAALSNRTRSGQWGAMVISLTKGDTLFAQNPDGQMLPASTMKMYTSALALDRFGGDYVFKTPVFRDVDVGADGSINGNLYIRGSGDPSLSTRFWNGDAPFPAQWDPKLGIHVT